MKIVYGLIALLAVIIIFIMFNSRDGASLAQQVENGVEETSVEEKAMITEGSYSISTEKSVVSWAGQKPLLEGYINSGSLAVSGGNILVTENNITGVINIDMNTLSVSGTPTRPGSESALEGHLKSERWFNVENFPEATFTIKNSELLETVETNTTYKITGDLTMKGLTNELTFLASISEDESGAALAIASFEFDRTLWEITAGSGSFFDNLADNVVDDMVAMSFTIVANK
jgi:polyisoprenoid-binding protein YceI